MDYQFIRNEANQVQALFSEDYIVLGYFLTDELGDQQTKIDAILHLLAKSEEKPHEVFEWLGKSYRLVAEEGSISITSYSMTHAYEEDLPESTSLSDMDQSSESGLLDFQEMLAEWRLFCLE